MRVLVIEDYAAVRESVTDGLREAGFAVDEADNGEDGWWYAESNDYDVIVLDLMLPKLDGMSILERLRERGSHACVIILTACDQVADRIKGLDSGADDYLVKPFAFDELLARVRSLVRRKYNVRTSLVRVDDLEINTSTRSVQRGDKQIELTSREYSLLEYLATRAGEVVTRTEIWEHIYDFRSNSQSNVVDVYIGYLRRKLESPGLPKLIHTRWGQGYVLGNSS